MLSGGGALNKKNLYYMCTFATSCAAAATATFAAATAAASAATAHSDQDEDDDPWQISLAH